MATTKKQAYSFWVALKKLVKNAAVMFGLPAVLYIVDNLYTIAPEEYVSLAMGVSAAVSYLYKNYLENK